MVSQTGPKHHIPGQFHLFQPFDLIYSLIDQPATVLSLLAKNVGVVHQSFHMCIDGQLCCKNIQGVPIKVTEFNIEVNLKIFGREDQFRYF